MPWSWIAALVVCAVFVGLEGLLAGRGVAARLAALRQPPWAAPMRVWIGLGLVYYALCFASLGRLIPTASHDAFYAATLLIKLMAANAIWNAIFFRLRRYGAAFGFNLLYVAVFGLFWWFLAKVDSTMAWAWSIYAVYQVYALAWGAAVWGLNRSPAGRQRPP